MNEATSFWKVWLFLFFATALLLACGWLKKNKNDEGSADFPGDERVPSWWNYIEDWSDGDWEFEDL